MAINLKKGERASLDNLTLALVGLGWDVNKYDGGDDFDLDAVAFLLDGNDRCLRDEDFVFYNNSETRDGAVVHQGDNRTGEGEGDDEVIVIDFTKIPQEVQKIAICVTIHDAGERHQNFGQVSNAYVRVAKLANEFDTKGEDQIRFDLEEEFSLETALVVCEIYKKGGTWRFKAVASGYNGGLEALVKSYGLEV